MNNQNEKKNLKKVSASVIKRLPRYFRYLGDLKLNGVARISSRELSQKMGTTDSQIRQDLNCFGGFGQQGYGYNVNLLYERIMSILGADCNNRAIIVGMGNLGNALARNMNFKKRGVQLIGLFDNDKEKIGEEINGLVVRNISEIKLFCRTFNPNIAVLTLPKELTQEMAEVLVEHGVVGFWNFANMELHVPGAEVENVHMGDSLMMLGYAIKQRKASEALEEI